MADPLAPGADLAKVYGEGTRCPACGAFARIVPTPDHRWMCGVCGAPRIQMPEGEPLPNEAELALAEAATAKRRAGIQRLASVLLGLPAAAALVLAIALGLASLLAGGVLVGTGIVLAILASRASRRASTEAKRERSAVERGYEAAIAAVMGKNRSPAEAAAALRIPEADVEAALAAQGHVRVALPARIAAAEPAVAAPTPSEEAEAEAEPAPAPDEKAEQRR
jgi:ribosomal protein S27AE